MRLKSETTDFAFNSGQDKRVLLLHCIHTGSGAYRVFSKMCTGLFPGLKRWGVKLNTLNDPVSSVRMREVTPPLHSPIRIQLVVPN